MNNTTRNILSTILRHGFLIVGAAVSFLPFLWMLLLASHPSDIIYDFPPPLSFGTKFAENFTTVMSSINLWAAMFNTLIVSLTVTFLVLVIDSLAAFAFAQFSFRGKNLLFMLVILTFLVPTQLATVPQFLIMTHLGWVGELKAVIIPPLTAAFGIFWLRQVFANTIRDELLEAATLDGCGFFRQYFHVALPSARPALAFLGMFTFIGAWNDFMWPLIVLTNPNRLTLQVALSQLHSAHATDYGMLMMGSLIAVIPLLIVFIIGSKQFISGITDGAVK